MACRAAAGCSLPSRHQSGALSPQGSQHVQLCHGWVQPLGIKESCHLPLIPFHAYRALASKKVFLSYLLFTNNVYNNIAKFFAFFRETCSQHSYYLVIIIMVCKTVGIEVREQSLTVHGLVFELNLFFYKLFYVFCILSLLDKPVWRVFFLSSTICHTIAPAKTYNQPSTQLPQCMHNVRYVNVRNGKAIFRPLYSFLVFLFIIFLSGLLCLFYFLLNAKSKGWKRGSR